jgi:hypothetical protein
MFEEEDAVDVAALIEPLRRLEAIERRRVNRRLHFQTRLGRQVPSELGDWPELYSANSADLSRLARWLVWAREHRGAPV